MRPIVLAVLWLGSGSLALAVASCAAGGDEDPPVALGGAGGAGGTSGTAGASASGGTGGSSAGTAGSSASGSSGSSGESGTAGASATGGTNSGGTGGDAGTSGANGTGGDGGSAGEGGSGGSGGASAGTSGASGAAGTAGTAGTNGASGTTGTSGSSGSAGTSAGGASGTSGANGTAGAGGTSGTSGTSGSSGTAGAGGGTTTVAVEYCNVQFPLTLTVSSGAQTAAIYGQVYKAGLTDTTVGSAAPGITAQLGYGPFGSDPSIASSTYQYVATTFNVESGTNNNNDEYQGKLSAPSVTLTTQYSYVYRFSLDNGGSWTYCDTDGSGTNSGLDFSPAKLGVMTVTPAMP